MTDARNAPAEPIEPVGATASAPTESSAAVHASAASHPPIDETPQEERAPEDSSAAHVRPQPEPTPTATPVDYALGTGVAPFTTILWDLDGTIADSAPGITHAIAKMLETFGLPVPSDSELLSYVGPPILDSFKRNGLDDARELEMAMNTYREIYEAEGELDSVPFEGVLDLITDAHAAGITQSTATSKPEPSAERILTDFGVIDSLEFVTGATLDESRSKKADVVEEALRRLRGIDADLTNVIMIGDRFYDVTGSAEHGIPSYYVTWGYGTIGEEQGSSAVVSTADELRALLGIPRRDA